MSKEKITWTAIIEVDPIWVEDGFNLTKENLHDAIISHLLPYSKPDEVRVVGILTLDQERIDELQGNTVEEIETRMSKTFEVTSGKINITDPCYDENVWCAVFNLEAENGTWYASVDRYKEYCARIVAVHEMFKDPKISKECEEETIEIGVDTGQAGIFDSEKFEPAKDSDRPFDFEHPKTHYEISSNLTMNKPYWGLLPHGAVCSAGHGDGTYQTNIFRKNNKVVAVEIIFIDPDLEEEDYE